LLPDSDPWSAGRQQPNADQQISLRSRGSLAIGKGCPDLAAASNLRHHLGMAELEHDDRPWGSYTVLSDAVDHKVKEIAVTPGRRLSYQRHAKRSEHWFIVRGQGVVTIDGTMRDVSVGDAVDIARGSAHRIEASGDVELVFIEVQRGDYFGEDDIERLEDDFGRS
jgi:mannose-6-phosphate isomerase